ncbi:MAG: hypothetical protein AAF438_16475 [Pseudomonadota bacterium]
MSSTYVSRNEFVLGVADNDPNSDARNGEIRVAYKVREAHMHVIGETRSGKSRFLFDCIRQDIVNGYGLCLIDPHGELYELVVNWLAQRPNILEIAPNIHPIRFSDTDTTLRFNPLHINHPDEAYVVSSNVVGALTRIFGGDDGTDTPRFVTTLDTFCTILALNGLPLAALIHFVRDLEEDRKIRRAICEKTPDPYFRGLGLELCSKGHKEYTERVESTFNRVHRFIRNPAVRRIFSVTENTLDLNQMMDEGHILLLNCTKQDKRLSTSEVNAIGSLFINNIFAAAETRAERDKPKKFMLFVDEVQNYVNKDIADILAQAAKRALFLTLAHQDMGQLIAAGEEVYRGVMTNALVKVVFRIPPADADLFVDRLFGDEIDFELIKENLITPHAVGSKITPLRSVSESETEGESISGTHSVATAISESENASETTGSAFVTGETLQILDSESSILPGIPTPYTVSKSEIESMSQSAGTGRNRTEIEGFARTKGKNFSSSVTHGVSESLETVYEWFSTQTYALEEQRYKWKREIFNQQARHAFMGIRGAGARGFTTRNIADVLNIPKAEQALLSGLQEKSTWISTAGEIPPLEEHPERLPVQSQPPPLANTAMPLLGDSRPRFWDSSQITVNSSQKI